MLNGKFLNLTKSKKNKITVLQTYLILIIFTVFLVRFLNHCLIQIETRQIKTIYKKTDLYVIMFLQSI